MSTEEKSPTQYSAVYVEELQRKLRQKDEAVAKIMIASRVGLPAQFANRIKGANPEEWLVDAEVLAKDYRAAHVKAPLGSPEPMTYPEGESNIPVGLNEFLTNIEEALNHKAPGFTDKDGNIWYNVL